MKLTKNFSKSEFDCKCGCEMPEEVLTNVKLVAENLQKLRDVIGVTITPTNGYRCAPHNKKIGGVPNSQHILGKAADIQIKDIEPYIIANIVDYLMENKLFYLGGVGKYDTFTHVDVRGIKARWDNRKQK